jgi:hypothetical protein
VEEDVPWPPDGLWKFLSFRLSMLFGWLNVLFSLSEETVPVRSLSTLLTDALRSKIDVAPLLASVELNPL